MHRRAGLRGSGCLAHGCGRLLASPAMVLTNAARPGRLKDAKLTRCTGTTPAQRRLGGDAGTVLRPSRTGARLGLARTDHRSHPLLCDEPTDSVAGMIAQAASDAERKEVQRFLATYIKDIAPTAVPMAKSDQFFDPIILRCTNDLTGELIGASLTCRLQLVAQGLQIKQMAGIDPYGLTDAANEHSELDLMAVAPGHRGAKVGTRLITAMEARLQAKGVRVWFGNVMADAEVQRLASFYKQNGFKIGKRGAMLPQLLGRKYVPQEAELPAFFFWKYL